ncbi:MAG: DASS family sodium-coupled anion symporter [Candidatus Thermoplasmatota archaeon]|nr:DASS family sodium-coupled anion symporter [Candidatus Thermoplasmatota archaeon]
MSIITFLSSPDRKLSWKNISIFLFCLTILIVFYLLPNPEGLTYEGKMMIGVLITAAILWITEPIPLAVTGLFIMILQPLLFIMPAQEVFSSFGNQAVFFLIGAFIIAGAVEKHGLHRRIALGFLKRFEKSPRSFTFGIMLSCALLSFIMPEHGVVALFVPIVVSILIAMRIMPRESNFGKISMLSVAYGCSIGSLGTLIGGARNPLTISELSNIGITVGFFDWMIIAVPVVFISLPLVWIILQVMFPIEIKDISHAKKEIEAQVAIQGSISRNEKKVALILSGTILLWILFSHYSYFGLAGIALLGSMILFFTDTINWKDVERKVPWGIILLYGGAITLGAGIKTTGAGAFIAAQILSQVNENPYLIMLLMIIITIFLTEIMSNTGAVAVLLPIGIAVAQGVSGVSPFLAAMLIGLAGGLSFMFVIATPGNAITYSAGYYTLKDLTKTGIIANVTCIIVLFTVAIIYWKGVLGL